VRWYTSAVGGIGTLTPAIVNTDVPGTYTLYVTQTDSGCTSARGAFPITVNAKPPVPNVIDSPGHYCPGQPFLPFTVVSGTGILWYNAPAGGIGNSASPTINTNIPGADTVWVSQTVLGCESDRTFVIVTVHNPVTAGFTYQRKFGCKSDTVVFSNTSTGTIAYVWDFGDHASSLSADPTHIYNYQGLDTVVLTSKSAYCAAHDTQVIDLVHPLHAQFTSDTNLICQGGTITFTDSSYAKTGTFVGHFWDFGDGQFSTSVNPVHTYPKTGVYTVYEVATDFVPCHDTAYKTIMVDTISSIRIAVTDTVICQGTVVTFTGVYSSIGNTNITWTLGNKDSIKNVNPLVYGFDTVGLFTVGARAEYRVCPEAATSRLVHVLPQPSIYLGPDTTICKGSEPLKIYDHVNGSINGATWLWNNGKTTPSIYVTEPGTYSATVRLNGCSASSSVKVINDCYMNIPNVFTPNKDGLNDYFYPRQYLSSGLMEFKMDIYNRWGQLIFETTSLDGSGWDGKLNNVDQPEGVYVYVIDGTFKDGQKEHHQGNVTLLR
jgi:gliding motility-associated-like protein